LNQPDLECASSVKEASRIAYGFVKPLEPAEEIKEAETTKNQKDRKYKRSRSGSIAEMTALNTTNVPADN